MKGKCKTCGAIFYGWALADVGKAPQFHDAIAHQCDIDGKRYT